MYGIYVRQQLHYPAPWKSNIFNINAPSFPLKRLPWLQTELRLGVSKTSLITMTPSLLNTISRKFYTQMGLFNESMELPEVLLL